MHLRCIFVSLIGLTGSCAAPETQAVQTELGAPPPNRAAPILPRSDQGLDATWFLGAWRLQDSACILRFDPVPAGPAEGPVVTDLCDAPWSDVVRWQRPEDGRALLELVTVEDRSVWRASAIQPTAIAGFSSDGALIRLYWVGDGPHPGWFSPEGHTTP